MLVELFQKVKQCAISLFVDLEGLEALCCTLEIAKPDILTNHCNLISWSSGIRSSG